MLLRVLGCSGGSVPGHHPTSFLLNDVVALDGGAITSSLRYEQQEKVDHVVLSHCHLDHVATLPFLLDNRFARQTDPIVLYGGEETLKDLRDGLFNNRIWPDFTSLRNRKSVALALVTVDEGAPFRVADLTFTASRMQHPVECFGYLIREGGPKGPALSVAGDTASTDGATAAVQGVDDLQALIIEVSWPDRTRELAEISGHLTPSMLAAASPLHPTARILVTHIKPSYRAEVIAELERHAIPNLEILEDGMEFTFNGS